MCYSWHDSASIVWHFAYPIQHLKLHNRSAASPSLYSQRKTIYPSTFAGNTETAVAVPDPNAMTRQFGTWREWNKRREGLVWTHDPGGARHRPAQTRTFPFPNFFCFYNTKRWDQTKHTDNILQGLACNGRLILPNLSAGDTPICLRRFFRARPCLLLLDPEKQNEKKNLTQKHSHLMVQEMISSRPFPGF